MGKVSGFILPIGVALVILVYASLGVLSYSTAKADDGFAQRNIEYNTAFYEAEGNFATMLAAIDELSSNQASLMEYIQQEKRLELLNQDNEYIEALFVEPISENVLYKGHFFAYKGKEIKVVSKGLSNIDEWKEKYLALWKGIEDGN